MANKRSKIKGRQSGGRFLMVPTIVVDSSKYLNLNVHSKVLLIDLFSQFRGENNGDFCATWSYVEKRGWRSRATLGKAIKELLTVGFIIKTRQGGKNKCNLYGVTWLAINDCQGKLDVGSGRVPSNAWKKP